MHDNKDGKAKRTRKKKLQAEPSTNGQQVPPSQPPQGRFMADVKEEKVKWLVQPWFPKGNLTVIVGHAGVGKSTCAAWLVAQAGQTILLPGNEESAAMSTKPRLQVNGADNTRVYLCDQKKYSLPRDRKELADLAKNQQAQLLVFDPLDSYLEDGTHENDNQPVREMLESCQYIAECSGAAVVGVRHPGKQQGNLLRGARTWAAVPRSIVELTKDGGTPPNFIIRLHKDSFGQDAKPRYYFLNGEAGKPKTFSLGEILETSQAILASLTDDRIGKRGVMQACMAAKGLFDEQDCPLVSDLVNRCRAMDISTRSRAIAEEILGIGSKPNGKGGKHILYRTESAWPSWLEDASK
jgi:hypothetical protein